MGRPGFGGSDGVVLRFRLGTAPVEDKRRMNADWDAAVAFGAGKSKPLTADERRFARMGRPGFGGSAGVVLRFRLGTTTVEDKRRMNADWDAAVAFGAGKSKPLTADERRFARMGRPGFGVRRWFSASAYVGPI